MKALIMNVIVLCIISNAIGMEVALPSTVKHCRALRSASFERIKKSMFGEQNPQDILPKIEKSQSGKMPQLRKLITDN